MHFKNMYSFVLFRHNLVFVCTSGSKSYGESVRIRVFSKLVYSLPACRVLLWVCFLCYCMLNNKAQIPNTNMCFSHLIASHFADLGGLFLMFLDFLSWNIVLAAFVCS